VRVAKGTEWYTWRCQLGYSDKFTRFSTGIIRFGTGISRLSGLQRLLDGNFPTIRFPSRDWDGVRTGIISMLIALLTDPWSSGTVYMIFF
jgi:hypothetical protein